MFLKQKRIVNRELLNSYHSMNCVVCGLAPCDPCHIKSKGSGGHDVMWNLMPLCRTHHTESHKIGILTFSKRYDAVMEWLKNNNWTIENEKLIRR
jgi:Putative HNHc nuclease